MRCDFHASVRQFSGHLSGTASLKLPKVRILDIYSRRETYKFVTIYSVLLSIFSDEFLNLTGYSNMLTTDEQKRLEALKEYEIMDTLPEEEYDNITSLASRICGTPISLITLLDDERQWFKSATGLEIKETPIEYAFCTHAIQNPYEIMVVPDSRKDERFANNPFVTGEPHIIFYAGMPLVDEGGHALGTLCVLDIQEHTLTPFQLTALKQLAKQVVNLMMLKKDNKLLKKVVNDLVQQNFSLKEEVQKLKSGTSS